MGQNRKNRESQSNEQLEKIAAVELVSDRKIEKKLVYLQVGLMVTLIVLAALREYFFPSNLIVFEFVNEIFT